MRRILSCLLFACLSAVFLIVPFSCNDPTSGEKALEGEIRIVGQVLPRDAVVKFVRGGDTAHAEVDTGTGAFEIAVGPGTGMIVITADEHGRYKTSLTYTEPGVYDIGTIHLTKVPYPVGSVYRQTYSGSYLYYILFREPMDTGSIAAVSTTPDFDGNFTWSDDRTTLYFYPEAIEAFGSKFRLTIDTSAVTQRGETIEFAYNKEFAGTDLRISTMRPVNGERNVRTASEAYFGFTSTLVDSGLQAAVTCKPPIALSVRASGSYLYVQPESGNWPFGRPCTLTVAQGLKSASGAELKSDVTVAFQTEQATVSQVSPYNESYDENLTATIRVWFKAAMDRASTEQAFCVFDSTGDTLAGSFVWSPFFKSFTFTPDSLLRAGMVYTAAVDSSARLQGGSLLARHEWKFGISKRATVSQVWPNNEYSDADLTTPVRVYFQSAMDRASTQQAFWMTDSSGDTVSGTFTWSAFLKSFSFIPDSLLQSGMIYTAVVDSTAKLQSGERIARYEWKFGTETPTQGSASQGAISLIPAENETGVALNQTIYLSLPYNSGVNIGAAKSGFSLLDENGGTVPGYFYTGSSYLYYYPQQQKVNKEYTIQVVLANGDTLVSSTYRTIPFQIDSLSPSDNGTRVMLNDGFRICLNSAVDKTIVVPSITITPAIECIYSLSDGDKKISLLPFSDFWPADSTFTVTVAAGQVRDMEGNSLTTKDSVFTFHTNPVRVINHAPLNGQLRVTRTDNVVLAFNTSMNTTATEAAFSVKDETDIAVAGTFTWDAYKTVLTFAHPGQFAQQTKYTVTLDSTAEDSYGIRIPNVFTTTFTTDD